MVIRVNIGSLYGLFPVFYLNAPPSLGTSIELPYCRLLDCGNVSLLRLPMAPGKQCLHFTYVKRLVGARICTSPSGFDVVLVSYATHMHPLQFSTTSEAVSPPRYVGMLA